MNFSRFTYHSSSMNAQNLPDAVKNQSLFSNYYLDSRIVEQPQWADTPNIESDYAAIKDLFNAVAPNAAHLNEAQTEHEFIQPLLEQLGHTFEVQPSLQTSQGPQSSRLRVLSIAGCSRCSTVSDQHKRILQNCPRCRRRKEVVTQSR